VAIVNFQRVVFIAAGLTLALASALTAGAQSTDQSLPTPVLSNEINGTIRALDLGDPRMTRHFYAFEGVPGDLLVTLTSNNLNGDVDVFTAITFRPIMKITMYPSPLSPEVTKSFYLRSRQVLVLRVEARTPNDDQGTYKIHFGGAYEPFSGGIPVAEESAESVNEAGRSGESNSKRLSSVGARIEQPVAEPTPKPVEKSAEETTNTKPSSRPTKAKSARTTPTRNARGRTARTARAKPVSKGSEPPKTETTKTETPEAKTDPVTTGEEKPPSPPTERPSTREKPATQETPAPQPGTHLVIVENDGTKIDRPMSTVRRVVIEGGTIVIVLKTGRIERVAMSLVARMSIEPQQ
jgi:hypothetical protein